MRGVNLFRVKNVVRYHALTNHKTGLFLFLMCWLIYVFTYFGRLNYSAALADIVKSGVMPKDMAGMISTAFYFTYGAGQFINGFLGDILSPFKMIGIGTGISGLMNILMFFVAKTEVGAVGLIVIWAINGFAQSAIWSPLIRIISTVMPEEQRASACANMLISTAAGTLGSYLLSTLLLGVSGWSAVFLVPGIILAAGSLLWFVCTLPIVRQTQYVGVREVKLEKGSAAKGQREGNFALLPMLASSGVLFMLVPTAMMSMMKDGVTSWTPTFITEMFDTAPAFSVLLTTLLPLANIFGAMASHRVTRLIPNEMKSSAVFMTAAAIFTFCMYWIGRSNLIVMIVCLAVVSSALMADNNVFVSLVPIKFGVYGKASTVTGVMNASANLCCSLSSLIVGIVTERLGGWNSAMLMWMGMGIVGVLTSIMAARRWERFKQQHLSE